DVAPAAALCLEAATGPEGLGEVPEQGIVVGQPVECRSGDDCVEPSRRHREAPTQVRDQEGQPSPAVAEAASGLLNLFLSGALRGASGLAEAVETDHLAPGH